MEAPSGPVDLVLLDKAEHIRDERIGVFLVFFGDEVHDTFDFGTDLSEEDGVFFENGEHPIPSLMPVIGMP